MTFRVSLLLLCYVTSFHGSPQPVERQNRHAATDRSIAAAAFPKADLLDLNTATLEQLQALPGMGPVYARRVIEGRPYTGKNQLVTQGILPQETYGRIKDAIVARRPSRR